MATPVLTVANQLTMLRMALTPFLIVLILQREFTWALVVFIIAAVTDLLDGLIARLSDQRTKLGAMMDPVADKLLLSSSFVALTWGSGLLVHIPMWLTVVTLSRDAIIIVSVIVINLSLDRRVFYPSWLGKIATTAQLATAGIVLLLNMLWNDSPLVLHAFRVTLVLTVASAFHYVYLASVGRGEPDPE